MTAVDFGPYKRIVQYFYDPEPRNLAGSGSPIWCLGREYAVDEKPSQPLDTRSPSDATLGHTPTIQAPTPPESLANSVDSNLTYEEIKGNESEGGWPVLFLDDFEAKLWFTYRSGFQAIPKSHDPKASSSMTLSVRLRNLGERGGFTSDTGFGCMIRSGQSLLANSLLTLKLGRDWRRGTSTHEEREIVSLFADDRGAPYSIQRFVEHGSTACGKHPGEWFGPSATAQCIKELVNSNGSSKLRVYVTGDGSTVYQDSFMNIAKLDGITFSPTLVLVGTRLGIDKVNPVYYEALGASLKLPQSIGIAGGRPSASHYFIGVQDSNFFYLDPHIIRPALALRVNVEEYTNSEIDSCHTRRLRLISVKEMDPSMLIGFLIRDEQDWHQWRTAVASSSFKAIIHIADSDPSLTKNGGEREGAIDEVESFDGDAEEDDDVTILNA